MTARRSSTSCSTVTSPGRVLRRALHRRRLPGRNPEGFSSGRKTAGRSGTVTAPGPRQRRRAHRRGVDPRLAFGRLPGASSVRSSRTLATGERAASFTIVGRSAARTRRIISAGTVTGDDADDNPTTTLWPSPVGGCPDVLPAIAPMLFAVVLDSYFDVLPAHVQIRYWTVEFVKNRNLRLRFRQTGFDQDLYAATTLSATAIRRLARSPRRRRARVIPRRPTYPAW